jgi:ABC-2 type transport system permease protein
MSVDRQALVMALAVPVIIATILGWLDKTAATDQNERLTVGLVDADRTKISEAVVRRIGAEKSVRLVFVDETKAKKDVQSGSLSAAIILPHGLGSDGGAALMGGPKPVVDLLADPSKPTVTGELEAIILKDASSEIASASFGGFQGGGSAPIDVHVSGDKSQDEGLAKVAHDYAGFGLQGLLFFAIEAGVGLIRERRSGVWQRVASSPIPTWLPLVVKCLSSSLLALAILIVMFLIAFLLFGVTVQGSKLGFALLLIATGFMAGTFGLFIASVCKSETQGRAIGIMLILIMLATGGAWFPMERMPVAVQHAARFFPVWWAVDGLDSMTWRAQGLLSALPAIGSVVGFGFLFAIFATIRFRTVSNYSP